ncbi:MAG: tetratricopeptide repeat protein [Phycisphaerae bacterium]|nr:tetratricopeptide repeat protein [Phycisphaerae bacterium]
MSTTVESKDQPQIVDVWSRTSRRYRRRSVLMLLVLALMFAGLCCFTFWLRTGVYWPWMSESYGEVMAQSFRPSGSDQITLSDFLTSPISVKDRWIHGIIMGLLLASLSSIPLLVAILYRFPFSVIFAVMVVLLAAMPWLGITVLIGCSLTALRPFRFSFRYASALVGLIPIAIYFVSASLEPADSRPKLIQHQALLYAPWVLAVLGSCIICAVALAIARLINYRPGGIPPVLVMLFAIPVFLFHTQVGRDELEYRLLECEVGPGSRSMFATMNVGAWAKRDAARLMGQSRNASDDEVYGGAVKRAIAKALLKVEQDRMRALARCDSFILQFPKSRYVPNVLFLKGRVLDQRIHRAKLERDHLAEYVCHIPNCASRTTWETLAEKFPSDDLAATAMYKLAILDIQDGRIDSAIAWLEKLTGRFDVTRTSSQPIEVPAEGRPSVFYEGLSATRMGVNMPALIRNARCLMEMVVACRDDRQIPYSSLFGERSGWPDVMIHPMQILMRLDETDPHYKANLEGIARHCSDSQTRGYVEIRLALLEPAISRRIQRFQNAAKSLVGQPAGAEAMFRLGAALQEDRIRDEAKLVFDELTKHYPDSCWAQEARKRLSSLSMLEATAE